jgi:polysaccharide export outer membrane protein
VSRLKSLLHLSFIGSLFSSLVVTCLDGSAAFCSLSEKTVLVKCSSNMTSNGRFALRAVAVGFLICAGCSSSQPSNSASTGPVPAEQQAIDARDASRLNRLLEKRDRDVSDEKFSLGPSDVLDISVPIEELEHREVRVTPQSTITLPLIGEMSVAGMTEEQFTEALKDRLSTYMHDPPVAVFVKSYGSRQVAVTGAVQKPGLYTLSTQSDSLIDMLSRAGGMTGDAATRIIFIPNDSGAEQHAAMFNPILSDSDSSSASVDSWNPGRVQKTTLTAIQPEAPDPQNSPDSGSFPASSLAKLHPIMIDLNDPPMREYLNMPARPGDVLIVPSAGQVTVGGWVATPGAYKLTPNMTALSAISSAGGALFSSSGEILRTSSNGDRLSIPLDLSDIKNGKQPDVPVTSGDAVLVDRSAAGAVPYMFYEIFTKFGTGMYIPVP